MIIDFRVRPPYRGFLEAAMWKRPDRTEAMASALRMKPAASLREASLAATLSELDDAGIDLAVVPVRRGSEILGDVSNDDVVALVRESAGRMIGLGAPNLANPHEGLEEVSMIAETPEFAGVVVEPGLWRVPLHGDDRRLYPIYQACSERNLPLLIMGGGNAGPDITYTDPAILDHICADFPELKVVAAHGGWPWVYQTLHVAFRRANLYLSPDMYLFGMAGWQAYVEAATGYLADRFLFGTAYPFVGLKDGIDGFRALFAEEHHERLLGGNAETLLGLGDR